MCICARNRHSFEEASVLIMYTSSMGEASLIEALEGMGHLHYIMFDFSRVQVGLLCSFLPAVKSIKSVSGDDLQLGNKGPEKGKSTYR